ncbi:hypothetical protein F383_08182 [Gossypium arboreum]|uniref:Uncharacterized protein n=1 Tax=Gossypium arboreum TaxID=29729 RepID=A0A0B0NI86_GOSAR|nr:hypothetical protein F383_08182 [Gossypium arboreum]
MHHLYHSLLIHI